MTTPSRLCPASPHSFPVAAGTEGVNELEEKQEQLPSWNRRGGPKGQGGSKVEIVLLGSNKRMGRRVIRSIYHPGAPRHPSCSRRGVAPAFPPIHSHLLCRRLQGRRVFFLRSAG